MIKFFRKLRLEMLKNNKLGKYLTYAFGEIILVVIGILIALTINNWNTQRLDKKEAKIVKQNIHDEFVKNQLILRKSIELYSNAYNSSLTLMNLMGMSRAESFNYNLDSLFNASLEVDYYFPTSKSFDNNLQSARTELLESEELKNLLMDWISSMDLIRSYDELITNWLYSQYIPYLTNSASLKQMNIYNSKVYGGRSNVKIDYYGMFQDIRLENILSNYLYLIQFSIEKFKELEGIQQRIMDLTSPS